MNSLAGYSGGAGRRSDTETTPIPSRPAFPVIGMRVEFTEAVLRPVAELPDGRIPPFRVEAREEAEQRMQPFNRFGDASPSKKRLSLNGVNIAKVAISGAAKEIALPFHH
jgi:hypothetical protein